MRWQKLILDRVGNATRNIIWGIIEKIIIVLMPFITRTVLIKVLGAEYLGLNSLFVSILQVLSISELGLGTAIVFSMYKPIAEDDNDTICALLNVYRKLYHIVGMIILIGGLGVLPFLPKLITGHCPNDVNIYILYLIYLANTVISYFLYAYKTALFSAFQRNDLASKRSAAIALISNILQIIVLFTMHNYYAYVLIIPFATILTNLANAWLANRMYPNLVCKGTISTEMKDGLKKRITGLLSYKIYGVIFSSVDALVISAFLGLTPLAIYNNYFVVQSAIIAFMTILTNSITAGIGNKMITNTPAENYEDFKNILFANGWIASWFAILQFCLYQHFMTVWVGKELVFPFITMTLMVFYFLLPRITTITMTYKEAAGLWWEDRWRPLVATIINVTANLLLVRIIGMNGVIISTLICTIFINVPWGSYVLFKYYFKRSPIEYYGLILYYVGITSVVGCITLCICNLLNNNTSLLYLLLKFIICSVIPNILLFAIYYKKQEFKYSKELLLKIIKKYTSKAKGEKYV